MTNAVTIWTIIMVTFSIIELLSINLITGWFAAGAACACIAAAFGVDSVTQMAIFVTVSIVCLVTLRPSLAKKMTPNMGKEPCNKGEVYRVVKQIEKPPIGGRVVDKNNITWAADSITGEVIPVETVVVAEETESVRLKVRPINRAS